MFESHWLTIIVGGEGARVNMPRPRPVDLLQPRAEDLWGVPKVNLVVFSVSCVQLLFFLKSPFRRFHRLCYVSAYFIV